MHVLGFHVKVLSGGDVGGDPSGRHHWIRRAWTALTQAGVGGCVAWVDGFVGGLMRVGVDGR